MKHSRSGVLAVVVAAAVLACGPAAAQIAPSFSSGPTIPFFTVSWDDAGKAHAGVLNAGAGYSLNWNLYPSPDGSVRWVNVGFPTFVTATGPDFTVAEGVTVGVYNNLLSLGVALDLVNIDGNDSGALVGDVSRRNVKLLLAFGFNLGGGQPAPPSKAATGAASGAPPCYFKLKG